MDHVTSGDGTRIAYERSGSGPPLVLVHGSLNDHGIWAAVAPALAQHFIVYAMDRRGRGDNAAAESAMERQFEDVFAVIDAAGEPVDLIGHSFGAHCALGAAAMAPERVKHLVLYEPPSVNHVRVAVEAFDTLPPDGAAEVFMRDILATPPEQLSAIRQTPFWPYLTSFASTMGPEGRAMIAHGFNAKRYASLTMPVLLLQGGVTADAVGGTMRDLAEHMPNVEWHTFEGQGHGAMLTAAQQFSDTVLAFLSR